MSLWDAICDNIICPVVEKVGDSFIYDGLCEVGSGIDKAVNVVVIDGIGGGLDSAIDFAKENPVKSVAIVAATVATGGLAAASTGVPISTLSGAALSNASLAALGGGTLMAGGGGMAAGATVVTVAGAATGAAVSTGVAVKTS